MQVQVVIAIGLCIPYLLLSGPLHRMRKFYGESARSCVKRDCPCSLTQERQASLLIPLIIQILFVARSNNKKKGANYIIDVQGKLMTIVHVRFLIVDIKKETENLLDHQTFT